MPLTSQTLVRSTIALLAVGLIALLGILGTAIWLSERTQTYFNQVIEARNARTATVDLRNSLQVAETAQRGFLLTGDEAYLRPYPAAVEGAPLQFQALKDVLAPYPQAKEAVGTLDQAITQKLTEMEQTIALKREGRDAEALAIVSTNAGKELMDQAHTLFTSLIRAADDRVFNGITDQRESALALRWVSVIGGIVIILVVGGSALTVVRYTRELASARSEVEQLNVGLEERVRERTLDLKRANEEIQRFAYIVTHDLRAPLVNIMGFTSELEASIAPLQTLVDRAGESEDPALVEAKRAASEELPEAIGFIRSSTKKMDGLINAILRLSREGRRTLRPEPVELKAVAENSAGAVQHQIAEADGSVEIDLNVPTIVSDRMALEQVVGNLLDNAVKYRRKDVPLRIVIRGRLAPHGRVSLEVEDNGRGIAAQDHQRIFDLFRRSGSQDQPGEGIGLAHVRTVVRNLGGDITVKSELGQGSVFKIVLPRDLRPILENDAT